MLGKSQLRSANRRGFIRHNLAHFGEIAALLSCCCAGLVSCGGITTGPTDLSITEVCSNNAGAWVDERGETDDFVELINTSDKPLNLANFEIGERGRTLNRLPSQDLAPGERVLVWADGSPEQGRLHLPFRVSSRGEVLAIRDRQAAVQSQVTVPQLAENEVWARFPNDTGDFQACRYASPLKPNGAACAPPKRPDLNDEVTFARFDVPAVFPEPTPYLEITELALRPAEFVELVSTSEETLPSGGFSLRVAAQKPGQPWPTALDGVEVWNGQISVAPHSRLLVPLAVTANAPVENDPEFEGVLTLFDRSKGNTAVWR